MVKISPPLVFTLMYRGLPRGTVRMHPIAFPPVPGSWVLRGVVALTGWLEATADYAEVREELTGEAREMGGLESANPEVMQERVGYWEEWYRSNGLGFLDESGNSVACDSITLFEGTLSVESGLEPPPVMVTALFGLPGEQPPETGP